MPETKQIVLDYKPRAWQRKCHLTRKRFAVWVLHRRAGKTEAGIMELIDKAMQFSLPLGLFSFVAPYLKQAKLAAWLRMKEKLRPLIDQGAVGVNESELAITFRNNGAMIRIFGADNPDAMRTIRLDGCVIDEMAQIKPEVWTSIIRPMLADRNGWAIFTGTPNGVNLFSELYYGAASKPEWNAEIFTCYDTDALPPDEIAMLKRDMTANAFAREMLCDFSASAEDQLISLTDAMEASRRVYTERDVGHAPMILGVDPARFGDDRTVILPRRGVVAFPPIILRGADNMQVAARVAREIEDRDPDAVFIDSGAGAGVIDRLRQLGFDVIEVPFGGKANMEAQFVNRRSEMWWLMKEWIESSGSIPSDQDLIQELSTPTYWFDASGRKVLESKDEIKKRLQGGGSPDIADALALTFASPVAVRPPIELRSLSTKRKGSKDYDPYAGM